MSYYGRLNSNNTGDLTGIRPHRVHEGSCEGRLHSIESLSTCDGPGLRQVIFLQGCPLRCRYCHNPDSWSSTAGQQCSAQYLHDRISRFGAYSASGGGVTISGGEPLFQPCFLLELLYGFKLRSIHTAIDTSGWPHGLKNDCLLTAILAQTDLLLLDVKDPDTAKYYALTGIETNGRDYLIQAAIKSAKPVWLRHVALPKMNDTPADIDRLASWIHQQYRLGLKIENVAILPYHRLGLHKYEEANIEHTLADMPAMTEDLLQQYNSNLREKLLNYFQTIPFDLT